MATVIRGFWGLAVLGAIAALYVIVSHVLLAADTAEKQAQCSAVALAFVLTPYCLARAVEELARRR